MKLEYNEEEIIKAKNTLRKIPSICDIWKNFFAPSNRIGNCTNLFRKLNPKTKEEFFNKYFQYAETHTSLPIYERGLTVSEIKKMSQIYADISNYVSYSNFDTQVYLNDALCHIIVETYEGKQNEIDFMKFLNRMGYQCDYFDGKIDTKYGVDIKVINSDGITSAIQIKPLSFFTSSRYDTRQDRIAMVKKYHKFLNDYGHKTYYAIYVKNKYTGEVKWVKNGDGFRFKLNELFDYDINDIDKCKEKRIIETLDFLTN